MSDAPKVMIEHYREQERQRILAMEPGRELDCLIIQRVFKKLLWEERPNWYFIEGDPTSSVKEYAKVPRYSTNISAAWGVFEKQGWQGWVGYQGGEYRCNITWEIGDDGKRGEAEGSTAPEVICKAALLAMMD